MPARQNEPPYVIVHLSRSEQSERKAYHLFTTLAHNLADRYPSFKIALGNVVKDKTDLRCGTRDYLTLFESLILEPLEELHIVGPILVVIDALDESGDTTGRFGLHTFLAKNIIRLPSNFRVVITTRPQHPIVSALDGAQSVRTKDINDTELAADASGHFRHYSAETPFERLRRKAGSKIRGIVSVGRSRQSIYPTSPRARWLVTKSASTVF